MKISDKMIENIRQAFPLLQKYIYMNTGSTGPLSSACIEAISKSQLNEPQVAGISMDFMKRKKQLKEETKQIIAGIVNANIDEICLTRSTTEGLNIILAGMSFKEGDEIITTDKEHESLLLPLFLLKKRYGVVIKTIDTSTNLLCSIKREIELSKQVKLIAMSHVAYGTGEVFQIQDIIGLAHSFGIAALVDGAQAVGAIPVDLHELGVDYYSFSGQKWLCGPEGTGALYISSDKLPNLLQTYIGYCSVEKFETSGNYLLHNSSERFEVGSMYLPAIAGQAAGLKLIRDEIGIKRALERGREVSELARQELRKLKNVRVITPVNAAGLTSFFVEGVAPQQLVRILACSGIIIRSIPELNCSRISIGFFNTESEIEKLLAALRQLNYCTC